jgi:hypothetical protein
MEPAGIALFLPHARVSASATIPIPETNVRRFIISSDA